MLAGVLGQCSSLATLVLRYNHIGAEGATSLAGVLGQCSSLATLDLEGNFIGPRGIDTLRLEGNGIFLMLDFMHAE